MESQMLKFENVARKGDMIRAYDFQPFPGRGECYVEGFVMDISEDLGFKAFVILVFNAVFGGERDENRIGANVFVPMEIGFSEWEGRVSNISNSNS